MSTLNKKFRAQLRGVNDLLKAMAYQPTVAESFIGHCSHKVESHEINHAELGYMMRKLRIAQSVSLRAHAKLLKLSGPYLSDLELGRRAWSKERVGEFLLALPKMPDRPVLHIGLTPPPAKGGKK